MAKTAAFIALLAGTALAMPLAGASAQSAPQPDAAPAKPGQPTLRAPPARPRRILW